MGVCTFFGHSNATRELEPRIREVIEHLIREKHADCFYVGNNGSFDYMVRKVLKELATKHPHIRYSVVLAYLPQGKDELNIFDYSDTIYPEGLEGVHPRYAICKRNEWMIEKADVVVTYVTHDYGGANRYKKLSMRKKKRIIELSVL